MQQQRGLDHPSRAPELDNGNDHRAGTIKRNIEKHTQVRLRVHRIVITRLSALPIGQRIEL
jgi:hypothetical protein